MNTNQPLQYALFLIDLDGSATLIQYAILMYFDAGQVACKYCLYFLYCNMCLCCTVDKALPHTMSTDASLGSVLPADALSHSITARHKSMSLDLDNLSQTTTELTSLAASDAAVSRIRRSTRSASTLLGTDVQVVVAWLESFEDYLTFPVGEFHLHSHFVVTYASMLLCPEL